jgi:hypothetical protein
MHGGRRSAKTTDPAASSWASNNFDPDIRQGRSLTFDGAMRPLSAVVRDAYSLQIGRISLHQTRGSFMSIFGRKKQKKAAFATYFYRPENIIGFSGELTKHPIVHFLSPGGEYFGRIVQIERIRGRIGREVPKEVQEEGTDYFYEIRNVRKKFDFGEADAVVAGWYDAMGNLVYQDFTVLGKFTDMRESQFERSGGHFVQNHDSSYRPSDFDPKKARKILEKALIIFPYVMPIYEPGY